MTLKNIWASALVACVVFAIATILLCDALQPKTPFSQATSTSAGDYATKPLLIGITQ